MFFKVNARFRTRSSAVHLRDIAVIRAR